MSTHKRRCDVCGEVKRPVVSQALTPANFAPRPVAYWCPNRCEDPGKGRQGHKASRSAG